MNGLVVFGAALGVYLLTLAPGMLRGDSGEFQWAMASLNVAHATGYPLFTLLGFAWLQLPLPGAAAWRLNLLSPLFGAAAVTVLYLWVHALTRQTLAALTGAIFFALAPAVWFNASILEVYSLHAFLLALMLYWLWRWSREPQQHVPLYLAFFTFGLALAHHRLTILALPALLFLIFATDRRFVSNLPRVLLCLLLTVPGLLLYLYVPLRLLPEGFTLEFAVNDIILGREYAASLLHEFHPWPVLFEIPARNFQIGLGVAALGAFALFQTDRKFNIALWLVYLADVGFALVYTVPDVEVFLMSAFVVTGLWIGAGAAALRQLAGSRWRRADAHIAHRVACARRRVGSAVVNPAATGAVLVALSLLGLVRVEEVRAAAANEAGHVEARARAILQANLPRGSLLELDWETATAIRFLQTTEGIRQDLEARPIELGKREEMERMLRNVDAGRAVFVEGGVNWKRAPAGYLLHPMAEYGQVQSLPLLARVERTRVEMHPLRAKIGARVKLVGYSQTSEALTLYWRVLEPLDKDLATFVHYFDAEGNKILQDDRAGCCEAIYGYRTREWQVGRLIADQFKPAPPGTRSIHIGMYENIGGEIEAYGETIALELSQSDR